MEELKKPEVLDVTALHRLPEGNSLNGKLTIDPEMILIKHFNGASPLDACLNSDVGTITHTTDQSYRCRSGNRQ